jgi:hypothetical protein
MNRRSFFAKIGLGAAGILLAPKILLPQAEKRWVPNSNWVAAPYEIWFWSDLAESPGSITPVITKSGSKPVGLSGVVQRAWIRLTASGEPVLPEILQ